MLQLEVIETQAPRRKERCAMGEEIRGGALDARGVVKKVGEILKGERGTCAVTPRKIAYDTKK